MKKRFSSILLLILMAAVASTALVSSSAAQDVSDEIAEAELIPAEDSDVPTELSSLSESEQAKLEQTVFKVAEQDSEFALAATPLVTRAAFIATRWVTRQIARTRYCPRRRASIALETAFDEMGIPETIFDEVASVNP